MSGVVYSFCAARSGRSTFMVSDERADASGKSSREFHSILGFIVARIVIVGRGSHREGIRP
jgi:hypothetical protein